MDTLSIKYIISIVLLLLASINSSPSRLEPSTNEGQTNEKKCGYESCPEISKSMLNIHIVPHSHDDVGWLKTVDQYYYGSKTHIQKAGVQYILDSVIQALIKDKKRRFVYAESAFFFKWWNEQTSFIKKKVQELVNEGRLEFVGGAWSMNDEATTHYQSLIDQFTIGLKRLNDTFGLCGRPRIGWQIDPFGHSRGMALILTQMGFDGLFFARLDYQDKLKRMLSKSPEMVWKSSPNLGKRAELFTGILYNHYSAPPGFCFDILCTDEPIIDGKYSPDNNVDIKIKEFFNYLNLMSKYYKTNNLMIPMGDDFNYQDANINFKNIDKLIKYSNEKQKNGSNINIFYSTPLCYLKSLYSANIKWPSKEQDFFPYSSDPHAFWSGFYTSRPTLKGFERQMNNFLQICKQLTTWPKPIPNSLKNNLNTLSEAMGIMQHHDGITGTEKQEVAFDYMRILDRAAQKCSLNTKFVLNQLSTKNEDFHDKYSFETCWNLNISQCTITEQSNQFIVTLYNPLSHLVTETIRFPIDTDTYIVHDHRGNEILTQTVPIAQPILSLKFRFSRAIKELIFQANNIPAHGYKSYFVSKKSSKNIDVRLIPRRHRSIYLDSTETIIENEKISIKFDDSGFLSAITTYDKTIKIRQEFFYYKGAIGNNLEFINRSSGAYIFRPNGTVEQITQKLNIKVVRGPIVQEVHQIFNDWISQVIRIYKNSQHIEFEWLIGPIPIEDQIGKEIVSRFITPDIKSNGIFYTDSNGREMLKRIRNKRETFEPDIHENIAGNYYPITTKISIEDNTWRLSVLTDRAQGGSSIQDGSLELMVHRRLLHDDAFGVGEALNETSYGKGLVVCGKHYLLIAPLGNSLKTTERILQLQKTLSPWKFFSQANELQFHEWKLQFVNEYSALNLSLPLSLNLLTIEPWNQDEILIRLEHFFEKDEDTELSKPARINLQVFLKAFNAVKIRESTLDGNMWADEFQQIKFQTEEISQPEMKFKEIDTDIVIHPMEIKTFILTIRK